MEIFEYPPIPSHTGKFYGINGNDYGYSFPESVEKWEFSITFNRWGAFVKHNGGKTIYTWPEIK